MKYIILACFLIIQYLSISVADDFIGCGGFVKSEVAISYSQIEVRIHYL